MQTIQTIFNQNEYLKISERKISMFQFTLRNVDLYHSLLEDAIVKLETTLQHAQNNSFVFTILIVCSMI